MVSGDIKKSELDLVSEYLEKIVKNLMKFGENVMFELNYRVIQSEEDDFIGQNGLFQIKCNDFYYGEMIENFIYNESLYNWFERLIRVAKNLMTREYVVLSDVETYNIWIEFKRKKNYLLISIVKAEKKQGSQDIEFALDEVQLGEWGNQSVFFEQFKEEIIKKGKAYIKEIMPYNLENQLVFLLEKELQEL